MANQALIKGELGVYTQPTFRGDLIAKPMAAAMDNFIKRDQTKAAANAKRAGEIEKKALAVQQKGSFAGVPANVKAGGQEAINASVDVYRGTGDDNDYLASEGLVDDVNHGNNRLLDQNAEYVSLVGEGGELNDFDWYDFDPDDPGKGYPSSVSRGSDFHAMNRNLQIFGGDKDIASKWNLETGEYDFMLAEGGVGSGFKEGQVIAQSDLNKGIFRINSKFGKMITDEAKKQSSKVMTGLSRYVDYGTNLKTKAEIISAFYDEMIPGVPSVYDHLKSQGEGTWMANADMDENSQYDGPRAKEEIKKYYNQILASEQTNYIKKQEEEEKKKQLALEQKNKDKRTPGEKDMDILFKQAITDNVNGDFTGTYGQRSIQSVEWRKHKQYDTNDKYTFLFNKKTGAKVGEFNLEDNPEQKSHIYVSGNNHFFFNANDPEDVKRFGLRMKQINL